MKLNIIEVKGKRICIGGIGRLFTEKGFPIELSLINLETLGIVPSIFRIVDELQKDNIPSKRIIAIFSELDSDLRRHSIAKIESFLKKSYEEQRADIFTEIFPDRVVAMEYLSEVFKKAGIS